MVHFFNNLCGRQQQTLPSGAIKFSSLNNSQLHTFKKWYGLYCSGLRFKRYLLPKLKKVPSFLLSQHFFLILHLQYLPNRSSKPNKPYHFLIEWNEIFQIYQIKMYQLKQNLRGVSIKVIVSILRTTHKRNNMNRQVSLFLPSSFHALTDGNINF